MAKQKVLGYVLILNNKEVYLNDIKGDETLFPSVAAVKKAVEEDFEIEDNTFKICPVMAPIETAVQLGVVWKKL